jgi:hypothetical protein
LVLSKELINYKDKLYWVYRKVKQGHIPEEFIIELRNHWGCDIVIRNKNQEETFLFFLREINDATIID